MGSKKPLVKMYSDFKSPYAYLAFEPGLDLAQRYDVDVKWLPFQLRQRGAGERSTYAQFKFEYSYIDVRRWGKAPGWRFEPPLKIYDTTPALIGGLFAEQHGRLREYGREVFRRFFARDFEADQTAAVAELLTDLSLSGDEFLRYFSGTGIKDMEHARDQAAADCVFGVPFFMFDGEPFWGNDRLLVLERRLKEKGLSKSPQSAAARTA